MIRDELFKKRQSWGNAGSGDATKVYAIKVDGRLFSRIPPAFSPEAVFDSISEKELIYLEENCPGWTIASATPIDFK